MPNGDFYEGEWIKGTQIRNGKGTLYLKSGVIYEGEFVNNLYHGKGKLNYLDGRIYQGEFLNGNVEG